MARRVRIGHQLLQQRRLAILLAPHLAEAEEEALIAGETIDSLRLLAAKAALPAIIGDGDAGQIGDILAQGQLAIHLLAGDRLVRAVLGHDLVGALLEALHVFSRPPIGKPAGLVIFAALIVEMVGDFVADHGADAAIVHGIIGIGIKERRLQNCGREHDFVPGRVGIGVHRHRRHEPLAAVHRLVQLGHGFVELELGRTLGIAHGIAANNGERRIILPLVRVADLRRERGELLARSHPRLGVHPRQIGQTGIHGSDDVLHQRIGLGLGFRREIFRHIQLAQRFAEHARGDVHAPLPARRLFRLAAQCLGIHVEIGIDKRLGQEGRGIADGVEGHIVLQHRQIGSGNHLGGAFNGTGVGDDHLTLHRDAAAGDHAAPIKPGKAGRQFSDGHRIIGLFGLTALHAGPVGLGDGGFQREDAFGTGRGIVVTGQAQHGGDVRLVLGASRHERCVLVVQIIVTIRQTQARLAGLHDETIRVLAIGAHAHEDRAGHAELEIAAHQFGIIGLACDGGDGIKLRLQRGDALRFDGGFIHEAGEEITDLLGFAARRATAGGGLFDDGAGAFLGQVTQLGEHAEIGLVGRNFQRSHIFAGGVAHEIVASLHVGIHAGHIETERADLWLGVGGQRRNRKHGQAGGQRQYGLERHASFSPTGRLPRGLATAAGIRNGLRQLMPQPVRLHVC